MKVSGESFMKKILFFISVGFFLTHSFFFAQPEWVKDFTVGRMRIIELHVELFGQDKVSTEYSAYQLLTKKPLNNSVVYVAAPWAVLINQNRLSELEKISFSCEGGFTICQHIFYEKLIPVLKKLGIKTLFTPHAIKGKVYDGVEVFAFPHVAKNGVLGVSDRDVLYSFIGYDSHPVRRVLFQSKHPEGCIIKERTYWHWARDSFKPDCISKDQQQNEMIEYQDVLSRSRFSLCPRGTGASTIRFWESLQAGAIPVLLADEMTLPEGFDWDSCIVNIDEKDVKKTAEIIRGISLHLENALRENCLKAYALFSEENLVRCIRLHYNDGITL